MKRLAVNFVIKIATFMGVMIVCILNNPTISILTLQKENFLSFDDLPDMFSYDANKYIDMDEIEDILTIL